MLVGCGLLPREVESLPPPIEPPQKSVKEVYEVRRGAVAERVPLRAMVAPANEATLFFKQGGRLRRLHVRAGDTVEEGQLLAELETGDLETSIQLAEINLEKLQVRLSQAQEKAQFKGGPDEHDLAILELDRKAAELNLDLLRRRLSESRLVAPFGGDITSATGFPGDNIQGFQPLVTVSDPTVLEIRAEVDDVTLSKLSAGQRVQITFPDIGEQVLEGTLVQIPDPFRDPPPPQGRGRIVKFSLADSPPQPLRQGMTGRAHVVLQAKPDVLVLPNSAIRSYAGRTYVLIMDGTSRREVDIAVGIVGETETEIVKGLKEGQQVIGR